MLTADLASRLAHVALANIEREYPRHIQHLMCAPGEALDERQRHPAFFGAYDWHSAVHMHWLLVRLLRLFPASHDAEAIAQALDAHLSRSALEQELAYFRSPAGRMFERPYGWAWALELQAEALRFGGRWSAALAPLASELAHRFAVYLRSSPYPVRAGSHGNSAFAGVLALDYARVASDGTLENQVRETARRWYERDRDVPLAYEPSLDDFLSPALVEALLMHQVLASAEYEAWLERYAPAGFGALAEPPRVVDHADPKQSHLDGLCFSRAWCFARLGEDSAAKRLIAAALPHVAGGDYAGEHWLASYAMLALSAAAVGGP